MNIWYSSNELAGLPSMPASDRAVRQKLKGIVCDDQVRLNGRRTEYHFNCLPPETRHHLLAVSSSQSRGHAGEMSEQWHEFDAAPESKKREAQTRLDICLAVIALVDAGEKFVRAIEQASARFNVSFDRVRKWFYESPNLRHIPRTDWLPALLPRRGGARVRAEISPEAWGYFLRDYLRTEKTTVSECYFRLRKLADANGWVIPSLPTFRRRAEAEIPKEVRILRRSGIYEAQQSLVPPQRRTRENMSALQVISGDGHDARVFCHLPDGTVLRPVIWVFQDVYSSAIVGYSVDLSENTEMLTIALFNMLKRYGIPEHIVFDRGSAALSEIVSGRTYRPSGRSKTKRKKFNPDEVEGVLSMLGIGSTWTKVIDDNNGRKGNARAKPVERFFHSRAGIGQFERDPAFEGAYTGASVTAKPANYGSATVPVELFIQKFDAFVQEWNNREGRRSEMARGRYSYQQVFDNSFGVAQIRRATEQQLRLCLLRTELVTVLPSGVVELRTGQIDSHRRNRYHCAQLRDYVGSKVSARFNPFDLHSGVYLYDDQGRYICPAPLLEDAGFMSASAARHQRLLQTQELERAEFVASQLGMMDDDTFRELSSRVPDEMSGIGSATPGIAGVTQLMPELPSTPAQYQAPKRVANGDIVPERNDTPDIDVNAALSRMAERAMSKRK